MRYMIIDSTGVLWESGASDALEQGQELIEAADTGTRSVLLEDEVGIWSGDLILVQEISRTR